MTINTELYEFLRINYRIISKEPIIKPAFAKSTFMHLQKLPMNYLQLINSWYYFCRTKRDIIKLGYLVDVHVGIPPRDVIEVFNNRYALNVYFIDEGIDSDIVKEYFEPHSLVYPIIQNQFFNLLDALKRDEFLIKEKIKSKFPSRYQEFQTDINPDKNYFDKNPLKVSPETKNNYFIINQIIGNYWLEDANKLQNESKKYLINENKLAFVIEQAKNIDGFTNTALNGYGLELHSKDTLPSLLLFVPYQNNINYKQDLEYNFNGKDENSIIKTKFYFQEFDDILYQFAAVNFSPIVRTPLVKFNDTSLLNLQGEPSKNKQNKFRRYKKFGSALASKILNDEAKEYIKNRKGQIVAVSDLPIEYLQIDDLPLCFTRDVCRINEREAKKGYDLTRFKSFILDEKLIENTLVIHCSPENDKHMRIMLTKIQQIQIRIQNENKSTFKIEICESINEIKQAIKKNEPTLLIFDCHGGYSGGESYLVVNDLNNDWLTSYDITSYLGRELLEKIPLVILSSCVTSPISSYKSIIPNAFLEAGVASVVASFYNLNIAKAGRFLLRILNGISDLGNKRVIHMNWLEFVTYELRSSMLYNLFIHKSKKNEEFSENELDDFVKNILLNLKKPEKRKEAIDAITKQYQQINPSIKKFSDLDLEWMNYTILGRADLIYFNSYIQEFQKIISKN